ncbi:MAG: hypothetical protein U0996_11695 [Planctomycetaceae bacterium]
MTAIPIFAGLSLAGVLMLVVIGLIGLKVVSVVMNSMLGRPAPQHAAFRRAGRSSRFPWFLMLLLLVGVLVVVRGKAQRSVVAEEDLKTDMREMVQELSREQHSAHEIVREVSSRLPQQLFEVATDAGLKAERDADGNIEVQAGPVQLRINGESSGSNSSVVVADNTAGTEVTVVATNSADHERGTTEVPATDVAAIVAATSSQDPPAEPAAPAAPQEPASVPAAGSEEKPAEPPAPESPAPVVQEPVSAAAGEVVSVQESQPESKPAATPVPSEPAPSVTATLPGSDEAAQQKPTQVLTPNGPGRLLEINFQNLSSEPAVRRKQLKELSDKFADSVIKALQEAKAQGKNPSGISEDEEVLVFELAQASLEAVTGQEASEFFNSVKMQLPKQIRHSYALVPVEAQVGGSVSPVFPLFASGALTQVADAIYHVIQETSPEPASQAGSDVAINVEPAWVRKPAEGQIVAETEPIIDSTQEAEDAAINAAVNEAIRKAVLESPRLVDLYGHRAASSVELQLDPGSVRLCIRTQYTRHEVIPSETGEKPSFRKIYMLLTLPETLTEAAEAAVRKDVQQTRIGALAVIAFLGWLSVTVLSCGFRLSRGSSKVRKLVAIPLFLASLPIAAGAVGFGIAAARDEVPRAPWRRQTAVVPITVSNATESTVNVLRAPM